MGQKKGTKFSEEHCKNISISRLKRKSILGFINSPKTRDKMSESFKGRVDSAETTEKRSIANRGDKNSFWIDGRTNDTKHRSWIKNKRNRDKRTIGGTHSLEEWEKLKLDNEYTCVCCKRKEPEIKLTEDHIIPVSKNGTNFIDNIQPLCRSCNSKKGNKIIKYNSI